MEIPSIAAPSMAQSGVTAAFGDIRTSLSLPNRAGGAVDWKLPAALVVGLLLAYLLKGGK